MSLASAAKRIPRVKDGSRSERETRYDEQGNREPGIQSREYDAEGNLVPEQGQCD